MHSGNLSQIALSNMWLLVQIKWFISMQNLTLGWTGLNFLTRKTNLHRFKQFIISIVERRDSTISRVLLSTNTPHGAAINTLSLNLILSTIWCQPKTFPSFHLNATKTFQFWQARQNSWWQCKNHFALVKNGYMWLT